MAIIAISDLHITDENDSYYRILLELLKHGSKPGDIVVLAGDIFELFVGAKTVFLRRYSAFLEAMKSAGLRGIKIHYLEGNHDFFISKAFAGIPNVTVHSESMSLIESEKRFFFSHGDVLDSSNAEYMRMRRFFRSGPFAAFISIAPGFLVQWIGDVLGHRSRSRRDSESGQKTRLRAACREYAENILRQEFDFVVLGHSHDQDEVEISTIPGKIKQYINIGNPRIDRSYLKWSPGDLKIHREVLL